MQEVRTTTGKEKGSNNLSDAKLVNGIAGRSKHEASGKSKQQRPNYMLRLL